MLTRGALPGANGPVARTLLLPAFLIVLAALTLGACSNNSQRAITGSVGVGINIALSTPGSVTSLYQGTALSISASVTNDVGGQGVTWSCADASGQPCAGASGQLTGNTNSLVYYNAPASGVVGALAVTITATSIADSAN